MCYIEAKSIALYSMLCKIYFWSKMSRDEKGTNILILIIYNISDKGQRVFFERIRVLYNVFFPAVLYN